MLMDLLDRKSLLGAIAVAIALLLLVYLVQKEKVYDIVGEEVITIVAPAIPEAYVVDHYESSVTAAQSWDHLEADTYPLLEIEPVEDVVYDYILDEQLTELPPLQG
jgi:hypothetical protein